MIHSSKPEVISHDAWHALGMPMLILRGISVLLVSFPLEISSQETDMMNLAIPQAGVALPRAMGERDDGRAVVPRRPSAFGGIANLENQLNAPYIPPLMSFEDEEPRDEESAWYAYDDQLELFRQSQRKPLAWTGTVFSTLLYDQNRFGVEDGINGPGDGLNSFLGGSVLMAYGEPSGRLHFDISYALALVSSWGDELTDSINQNLAASLTYHVAKTALSLNLFAGQQPYTSVDVGSNLDAINLAAEAILTHQLSPKWNLGASMRTLDNSYSANDVQDLTRSSIGVFADYQLRPKLTTGFGYSFGVADFSGSSQEQISHQVTGRLGWDISDQFQVSGSLGMDRTSSGDLANVSPIWELTTSYRLGAKSNLSMTAFRRVMPSVAIENQFFYMSGVMVGVGTQLTDRISIGAHGGLQIQDYLSVAEGVQADREDLLMILGLMLGYRLGTRTHLSLFYQYFSNRSSGVEARSLERGQLGLSLSVNF